MSLCCNLWNRFAIFGMKNLKLSRFVGTGSRVTSVGHKYSKLDFIYLSRPLVLSCSLSLYKGIAMYCKYPDLSVASNTYF